MTAPRLVYSPQYEMGFPGLEKLHPFDGRKFIRAHNELKRQFPEIEKLTIAPQRPVSDDLLRLVHSREYLESLESPDVVLKALEVPGAFLGALPDRLLGRVLKRAVVTPMRWATAGTVLAARAAVHEGSAVNLGGGFHHAKPNRGEGFCLFADVAVAVRALRRDGLLASDDPVAMIDLDAHMGNGVATIFLEDRTVRLFDMFNGGLYPRDPAAGNRIDCAIPLRGGTGDGGYLHLLTDRLPKFLDGWPNPPKLAFYNAGTDVYEEDDLGRLNLSAQAVLQRDRFVFEVLQQRKIPWVMVTSGGYSEQSWRLVAESVAAVVGGWLQ